MTSGEGLTLGFYHMFYHMLYHNWSQGMVQWHLRTLFASASSARCQRDSAADHGQHHPGEAGQFPFFFPWFPWAKGTITEKNGGKSWKIHLFMVDYQREGLLTSSNIKYWLQLGIMFFGLWMHEQLNSQTLDQSKRSIYTLRSTTT